MSIDELIIVGLMAAALLLIAVAFGAAIMWRLVNLPKLPPPLPLWVSALFLLATGAWLAAGVIAEAWLLAAGAAVMCLGEVWQLVASMRAPSRPSRR